MKSEYSAFERRMEILYVLMNQRIISRLELARRFSVSDVTIGEDIIALSRYAPIASKMGRYGGVYIIDEYKREKVYFSKEEEKLIERLVRTHSGREQQLLKMMLYKFSLPKAE